MMQDHKLWSLKLRGLMAFHEVLNGCFWFRGYQIGARHLKTHWFSLVCFLYYISRILNCKEIQQVHPKGNQSWMLIGRTDVEAETTILWPPDAKSWLIWKDPDAGKDWGQEEKGTTEDEMVGWHHQLNGHGFGWTPGVGDGQGGLVCCGSWDPKELDTTEWLNWTELVALGNVLISFFYT